MTRPTEALSCRRCFNLRTQNGRFWCRLEVDRDPAFEPRTHRTEWLDHIDGKKWARDTAQVCPWFDPEEGEYTPGEDMLDAHGRAPIEGSDGEDE